MQSSSRFQSLTARLHPHAIRTSFRRSSSASSTRSSFRSRSVSNSTTQSQRSSYASAGNMSPVSTTINSIVLRQPSIVDLEEERRSFGTELDILEPRPILFFSSVEERMGSF